MLGKCTVAFLVLVIVFDISRCIRLFTNVFERTVDGPVAISGLVTQVDSVTSLTCAVKCAAMMHDCPAYGVRPTGHQLYTCRLFNTTEIVPPEKADSESLLFDCYIRNSFLVNEPATTRLLPTTTTTAPSLAEIGTLVEVNGYKYYSSYRVYDGRIAHEELVTRAAAAANCSQMGLRLVSIESAAEQSQIENVIDMVSEGGQTILSRSLKEFWTSGNCSGKRTSSCVWNNVGVDGDKTSNISLQSYTNWYNTDLTYNSISVDTVFGNEWRRRSGIDKVWYLCDSGKFTPPSPTTTRQPERDGQRNDDPDGGNRNDGDRH